MLVLTRKPGEEIIIADDIRVNVVEVDRGRVRLGITAPLTVPVDRSEVHELKGNHRPIPEPGKN